MRSIVFLLFAAVAAAQSVNNSAAQRVTSASFAQLSSAANGSVRYCTNCTQASPCASGGTGALAVRRAGAWDCGSGLPAGCSAVGGVLTCPGGYASGDGTAVAKWEIPELSANGLNKQVIFGPASIAADGCVIWPSTSPGANQVLGDLGSSLTVESLSCRVLGWVDASVSGCTAVGGVLTCPGGYASGDGTAVAKWEIPELSANGVNKQVIFGPASIAADGCVVWPSVAPTSGQVLIDSGATTTVDGSSCRVLSWAANASNVTVAASDAPGSCTPGSFHMNSTTARAWYCADGTPSPIGEMNLGTVALPSCVVTGSFYFRTDTGVLSVCNGSVFVPLGGSTIYRDTWHCYRDGPANILCNFRGFGVQSIVLLGTNNSDHQAALATAAATGSVAGVSFRMPVTPTSWTFTVEIYSAAASAPTLQLAKTCVAPGSAHTTAYGGAQTATVSPAAAGRYHSYSFAVTPGSCVAGDFVQIQLSQTTAVATNIVSMSQVIQ
jgi:hypothetical protein